MRMISLITEELPETVEKAVASLDELALKAPTTEGRQRLKEKALGLKASWERRREAILQLRDVTEAVEVMALIDASAQEKSEGYRQGAALLSHYIRSYIKL